MQLFQPALAVDPRAWALVLFCGSGVQEVFAVAVLPRQFPDLINDDQKLRENSFVVPDAALADVPGRCGGRPNRPVAWRRSVGNGGVPRGRS